MDDLLGIAAGAVRPHEIVPSYPFRYEGGLFKC